MSIVATSTVPTGRRIDRAPTLKITPSQRAAAAACAEALALAGPARPATYAAAAAPCPPWCDRDIKGSAETYDDGVRFHISASRVVAATSGPETSELHVAVERFDNAGSPVEAAQVRLEGDGAMTAQQALALAAALQAAAADALGMPPPTVSQASSR